MIIQYMTACSKTEPAVFFPAERGLVESFGPGSGRAVKYDVALLEGYECQVVRNYGPRPSPSAVGSAFNPSLPKLIRRSHVGALLVHGYSRISHWPAYATAVCSHIPYFSRSESRPDRMDRNNAKIIVKRALIRPLVLRAGACLAIGAENFQFYSTCGALPDRIFFAPYSTDNDRFAKSEATGQVHISTMLKPGPESEFPGHPVRGQAPAMEAPGGCGDGNGEARDSRKPCSSREWTARARHGAARCPASMDARTRVREPAGNRGVARATDLFVLPSSGALWGDRRERGHSRQGGTGGIRCYRLRCRSGHAGCGLGISSRRHRCPLLRNPRNSTDGRPQWTPVSGAGTIGAVRYRRRVRGIETPVVTVLSR